MADLTDQQIRQIRHLINDPGSDTAFEDSTLQDYYELASYSLYGAVSLIWGALAAKWAEKVSIASGPTRIELNRKFDNAKAMQQHYLEMAGGPEGMGGGELFESVPMANLDAFDREASEYTWPGT